jgi:hypothetical protein
VKWDGIGWCDAQVAGTDSHGVILKYDNGTTAAHQDLHHRGCRIKEFRRPRDQATYYKERPWLHCPYHGDEDDCECWPCESTKWPDRLARAQLPREQWEAAMEVPPWLRSEWVRVNSPLDPVYDPVNLAESKGKDKAVSTAEAQGTSKRGENEYNRENSTRVGDRQSRAEERLRRNSEEEGRSHPGRSAARTGAQPEDSSPGLPAAPVKPTTRQPDRPPESCAKRRRGPLLTQPSAQSPPAQRAQRSRVRPREETQQSSPGAQWDHSPHRTPPHPPLNAGSKSLQRSRQRLTVSRKLHT